MRTVTRSNHGNALHFDPTMFVEFENLSYPKVVSYMTQFKSDFTSLSTFLFQINYISIGSSPILPLVNILFSLSKHILIIFEKHVTHYQTLETWIGHNATCYHILKALPHVLPPHALPYIFSEIFLVLGNLQRVTTRYRQINKKYIYTIF